MKTAEEWANELTPELYSNQNKFTTGSFDLLTSNSELVELFKKIQLDAWKAGMQYAAFALEMSMKKDTTGDPLVDNLLLNIAKGFKLAESYKEIP